MPFQIIRADITKVKADAIVNTANPAVAIGGGVDSAIYRAAGEEQLLKARSEIGILEPGEVGITPAFNLDAKYIIHASGPWWNGGKDNEVQLLRMCYDKCLQIAYDSGCKSIAFPLLATGTYGFPKELGLDIAVGSFTSFLEDHEMEITLVVFGKKAVDISGKLFDEVKSFVDDEYVDNATELEYGVGHRYAMNFNAARIPEDIGGLASIDDGLSMDLYGMSLEDELKNIYTDSFSKHLQQLINKKGLKNSEVYSAANISKQYFSKLLKGQVNPSKEKVLALAVGLRLNLDEAVDFLQLAGYALSPISQTDKVVEYFIRKGEYNVMKIDIVLFEYGLDSLSGD